MARQKKTEQKETEQKKSESKKVELLMGEELINKVKELGNLSKEEKAKACGYYMTAKNGLERLNMMQFLNALMEAEGIDLDSKASTNGTGGRNASYRISVQSNGNLLIGAAYTKQLDLNPGDEFEISLGRKHIHLKQVKQEGDEAEVAVSS